MRQVLEELNLTSVKDSLIGDKIHRGVSGGERKRVSIGKELCYQVRVLDWGGSGMEKLTVDGGTNVHSSIPMEWQPKLLLLDEPTSGLDSFTSIKVRFRSMPFTCTST